MDRYAARRFEKAIDPDNDGDNDTPGSGADPDNDPVTPAGFGAVIIGHLAQASHHMAEMHKAHEAHNAPEARKHKTAADGHMAQAKSAASKLSSIK